MVENMPVIEDKIHRPAPDAVQMHGLVGQRVALSRRNRLIHQEADHLLFPFQQHCPVGYNHPDRPWPDVHGDWQGEFLGTWLDAAVLSAWNAGDEALRGKLEGILRDWIATQAADGYFGTYSRADRWKSWDIWIHAHDLIGLLSYYYFSGDPAALQVARRAADCVLADFGPGKRFVHATGPHGGLASSAILEPVTWLYAETGEPRYLDWARWLVDVDWEQPGGPRTVSTLLNGGGVADIAGGKGIELLTNLAGLVELHRVSGEARYLQAVLNAWQDTVEKQLYITGTASSGEFFQANYLLPNDGVYQVGETCVSMGWLYLNLSLGRLLGDGRFFDLAEQTLYNHLLSAQSPDGKGWQYYTGLRDHKRYRWHTDPECCPSRGVRALAHLPQHACGLVAGGLVVNFYDALQAHLRLPNGQAVEVGLESAYPFDGAVQLQVEPPEPADFSVRLRLPGWCREWQLQVNGNHLELAPDERGYLAITRTWQAGDSLILEMSMPARLIVDRLGNPGRVALARGPLVYAADRSFLPAGLTLDDVVLGLERDGPTNGIGMVEDETSGYMHLLAPWAVRRGVPGAGLWREAERYHDLAGGEPGTERLALRLVPFFDAGNRETDIYREGIWSNSMDPVRKITYQVWLPYVLQSRR